MADYCVSSVDFPEYELYPEKPIFPSREAFAKELLESRYVDIIEMTLEEVSRNTYKCVITMENMNDHINNVIENKQNNFIQQ